MTQAKDNSQWGPAAEPKDEEYLANMAREHAEGLAGRRKPLEMPAMPRQPAETVSDQDIEVEIAEPAPLSMPDEPEPDESELDELAAAVAQLPQTPTERLDHTQPTPLEIRLAKADTRPRAGPATRLLIQIVLVAALTALAAAIAWMVRR